MSVAHTSTFGAVDRERDRDRAAARADVGDAHRHAVDPLQRRVDERLRRRARSEHPSGRGQQREVVEGRFHKLLPWWTGRSTARREDARYRDGEARLPEAEDQDSRQRQLTRMGNAAAGAGLARLMAGDTAAAREWFARAVERYRESYELAPPGSWGRPIAILKARILAGDWDGAERDARWTLERGRRRTRSRRSAGTPRPSRCSCSAVTTRRGCSRTGCARATTFPRAVADALAFIAAEDPLGYIDAVEAVLESFETRDDYLEDLPAADTVVVLQALAARRGMAAELSSPLLPWSATSRAGARTSSGRSCRHRRPRGRALRRGTSAISSSARSIVSFTSSCALRKVPSAE